MTTPPDATELARLVREGEATPIELVDEAIARVERINPEINAVIHPRFDAARVDAKGDLVGGPFRGVPMVVKDLGCAMAGEPMHLGNRALRDADYRPPVDSSLYRRFRELGFVAVGRTNTPEFGLTITTEPETQGPSRNPWNTNHSTGGSSGGSAAAVAAGLVPVGHANDGGGSIRVPASECGLVGLKPTRGRVSQAPYIGESWAGGTIDGVVTRSVRDTAIVLDGISGPEPGDPYYAPPPARPFADEVGADPGRLRIGIAPSIPNGTFHAECVAAVEDAGRLLEGLGHQVEESQPLAFSDEEFALHFGNVIGANTLADINFFGELLGRELGEDDMESTTWDFRQLGTLARADAYLGSVAWIHAWGREMASWWADDGFDVLVTPTLGAPPPEIGWLPGPPEEARIFDLLLTTAQLNMTGQPAVSLPLHWSTDGLPVGVQFVGAYAAEDALIRLASQIEAAAPWADRIPPIWAG